MDSEQIFKKKDAEINCMREEIADYKLRTERLKNDISQYSENNSQTKASIDSKSAELKFFLNRSAILNDQLNCLDSQVVKVESDYVINLSNYENCRKELILLLRNHAEVLYDKNAELKTSDSRRYDLFSEKEKKLESLKNDTEHAKLCLVDKDKFYDSLCTKLALKTESNTQRRKDIDNVDKQILSGEFTLSQKEQIEILKLSVSNLESDISSLNYEINSKKLYIQKCKQSRYHSIPPTSFSNNNQTSEGNLCDRNKAKICSSYFSQQCNPYHKTTKSYLGQIIPERTVVSKPVNVISNTPDDDEELFEDDVDLSNTQVIRACEEAEKLKKFSKS